MILARILPSLAALFSAIGSSLANGGASPVYDVRWRGLGVTINGGFTYLWIHTQSSGRNQGELAHYALYC